MINTSNTNNKYLQNKTFVRSVVYLGGLNMILRYPDYNTPDNQLFTNATSNTHKLGQMSYWNDQLLPLFSIWVNSGNEHWNRLKDRIIRNIIFQLLPVHLSDRDTSFIQSNFTALYDTYAIFTNNKRAVHTYKFIRR